MGRRKKEVDEAILAELIVQGATDREIGDILGINHTTVTNRFSPIIKKKRAERRIALRKAQYDNAIAGNATLLIWLGKQELEQTDKIVHSVPEDLTLNIKRT